MGLFSIFGRSCGGADRTALQAGAQIVGFGLERSGIPDLSMGIDRHSLRHFYDLVRRFTILSDFVRLEFVVRIGMHAKG
ncbi:hypothetical protein ACVWZM_000387 [Bradyrhizobium sp. USDA 4501]